jgi:hypothetical protein
LSAENAAAAKLVAYDGQKTMFTPKKIIVPEDGAYFKIEIEEDGRYDSSICNAIENPPSR